MKRRIGFCQCLIACAGVAYLLNPPQARVFAQAGACPDPIVYFSIDIGSDTEISDPQGDGDEVFDPGDLYLWGAGPATPADGFINDAFFFGFDPTPTAVPPTKAPVCFSPPFDPTEASLSTFDLDGVDSLDVDLRQFIPAGATLQDPIPQFPSNCIYDPRELTISFDDDRAAHYVGLPGLCEVPVTSPSPFLGLIYGMTAPKDELLAVTLGPGLPHPVSAITPLLDEKGLNTSLAPNPDNGDPEDDDTDALDIVPGPAADPPCPYVYWSPDHEANLGLDDGDIYLTYLFAGGPNFAPVIDDVLQLGIPDEADVDAFEFVWSTDAAGNVALALLFSVDDDDPVTTARDESGGLDPRMIYISDLTASYAPFLTAPLEDDVDAIANYCMAIVNPVGACCVCDGCIGPISAADCAAAGGIYQGDGTDCTTVQCEFLGACCLCDGTCIDNVTQAQCEDPTTLNGKWQGPCTTCSSVTCLPTGACCLCDGTCIDMVTRQDCLNQGGKFQGVCVTCAELQCIPFGACCLPDGTCVDMLTQADCTGPAFGGIYQGDCTDCASVDCQTTEACCLCDGPCVDLLPNDCIAQGGKPQGPNTNCATVHCIHFGACCLPDGTCVDMLSPTQCTGAAFGGTYQGDCTDCATINCQPPVGGACCFACQQYPGGPPVACVDVPMLSDCCALQGLFVPSATCATASCSNRVCPGDINGDNKTNVFDFGTLAGNFGQCTPAIFGRCDGDLNCDGCVNVFDFGILSSNFGCSLPPIAPQCCGP